MIKRKATWILAGLLGIAMFGMSGCGSNDDTEILMSLAESLEGDVPETGDAIMSESDYETEEIWESESTDEYSSDFVLPDYSSLKSDVPWKKAYLDEINNNLALSSDFGDEWGESVRYCLFDSNDDGIPEMMVHSAFMCGGSILYAYSDGYLISDNDFGYFCNVTYSTDNKIMHLTLEDYNFEADYAVKVADGKFNYIFRGSKSYWESESDEADTDLEPEYSYCDINSVEHESVSEEEYAQALKDAGVTDSMQEIEEDQFFVPSEIRQAIVDY